MNAPRRARQRDATDDQSASHEEVPASLRQRILDAAVSSLIEQGTARTTTLEVQRRAGVSRGALLHHFPTIAQLLSATVGELVRRNEAAVQGSLLKLQGASDPVERAIRVLAVATNQPAYLAELELWIVARTDPELHASLLEAEKLARKESERVMKSLFSASNARPAQAAVVALTLEFLRGLAVSGVLRNSPVRRQQMIAQWVRATKILLETLP
jgi:AcrR family transcriptional regulator